MADFPTDIQLPSTLKDDKPENPAITSTFEDGTEQTRSRFTRLRKSWTLTWDFLTETDYQKLRTHWDTEKGGSDSFSWTNPVNKTTYTVRYKDMNEADTTGDGWRINFSLQLKEV